MGASQPIPGPPGPQGSQGNSMVSANIDQNGLMSLIMSDNTIQTLQVPTQYRGVGIKTVALDTSGNLNITFSFLYLLIKCF